MLDERGQTIVALTHVRRRRRAASSCVLTRSSSVDDVEPTEPEEDFAISRSGCCLVSYRGRQSWQLPRVDVDNRWNFGGEQVSAAQRLGLFWNSLKMADLSEQSSPLSGDRPAQECVDAHCRAYTAGRHAVRYSDYV
jgi:hypothetical protein